MIILFDKNMNAVDFGYLPISSSANLSHELLQVQVNVEKQGYLFIYTSNESNSEDPVYFDDLKVTLHPGKVDAAYDYYPFGLPTAESWERVTAPVVDRKYQGPYAYWEKETDLHRFKARMYDGQIGRWLSTDPANQYNSPYLGMGNRPMKGVDKDGRWFLDRFLWGGAKSMFTGKNFFQSGIDHFIFSNEIQLGLLQTDKSSGNWDRAKQLISRFTWEAPQTFAGFVYSDFALHFHDVEGVRYYKGVTIIEGGGYQGGSITLGSFINLASIDNDSEANISVGASGYTFMHEFGHYLQSRESGPLYLFKYGLPSASGRSWTEHDANLRAANYFQENYGFTWNSNYYTPGTNNHKYSFLPSDTTNPDNWEYGAWFAGSFIGGIIVSIDN